MKLNLVRYSEEGFENLDVEARIYTGIGALNVQTPNGEVKACSGDLILELPSGPVVLKQQDATHLFGPVVGSLLSTPSMDSTKESTELSGDTDPSLEENSAGSSGSSVPVADVLEKSTGSTSGSGAGNSQ